MASDASGIKAGRAYVELGVNDKLSAALKRAKKQLEEFGDAAKEIGSGVRTAGLYVAGLGAAALAAGAASALAFTRIGGVFSDLSDQTGLSVELMSELETVIKDAGGTIEDFAKSAVKMQKAIFEANSGGKQQQETFARLGLDFRKLAELTPDQQFIEIAEALSNVANPTDRLGLALDIFGKSAAKLLPVIAGGAGGLEAFREQARRLGLSMSGEAAKAADTLGTNIEILQDQIWRVVAAIGEALAPIASELVDALQRIVGSTINWIRANRELVVTVMKWAAIITGIGGGLIAIGAAFSAVGIAVSGLLKAGSMIGTLFASIGGVMTSTVSVLASAFMALFTPVGALVAVAVAAAGAFIYFSGAATAVANAFNGVWEEILGAATDALGGIRDALAAGDLALAGQIAMAGLKAVLEAAWLPIQRMWYSAVYSLAEAWEVVVSAVADVFDRVVTAIKNAFTNAVSYVAKKIVDVSRFLGVDEWVLGVKLDDREVERMFQSIDSDTSRLTEQRNRELEQRSAQRERELQDKIKALEEAYTVDNEAAGKELEAARRELKDLTEKATARRSEAESARPVEVPRLPEMKAFDPEAIGKAIANVTNRLASRGTFNALASSGLLSNEDIQSRIADSTTRTADNTARIAQAMGKGSTQQLSFA
jgi:hypothetical protein